MRISRFVMKIAVLAVFILPLFIVGTAGASHVTGGGQSFTFLQSGFTQDIFGVSNHFMGGVAFAPDGDPWVDDCAFSGSELHRYDAQSTPPPVNGTSLHTESIVSSNAGCGLTNHPNGSLYTNSSGVVKLDASTGAQTGGPFGPAGNALGIAPDPQTGDLVYVGSGGTLVKVDPGLTTSSTFSTVTTGNFVDGIAWSPDGNFLFLSNRSPITRLTILRRDGTLVQHANMSNEPDGISFHAATPKFVVTNNTNGTMTRFDFPGDDFTQVPTQSTFASGGFRGDLTQVGPDGCIYLTQAGTRYNNGTVTSQNSLVRICGGFAPPPGVVPAISLSPPSATNEVGTSHTVTATVLHNGQPAAGVSVHFVVTGANSAMGDAVTGANGQASFTYTGTNVGTDVITACEDANGNHACDQGEAVAHADKVWTPRRVELKAS